jgi:hypothetical protein
MYYIIKGEIIIIILIISIIQFHLILISHYIIIETLSHISFSFSLNKSSKCYNYCKPISFNPYGIKMLR